MMSLSDTLRRFGVPTDALAADECCQPIGIRRVQKNGYWSVHFAGRSHNLHRLILEWRIGRIDRETQARHTCGNKWCVNPSHIVGGTIADNMADQYALGERVMNERHPQCRLSTDDARAIRATPATVSSAALAEKYGMSRSYVNQIRSGSRRRFLEVTDVPVDVYRMLERAT